MSDVTSKIPAAVRFPLVTNNEATQAPAPTTVVNISNTAPPKKVISAWL